MKRTLKDLINIFERMRDDGINDVDGEEFDTAVRTAIDVFDIIKDYVKSNGDISLSCGSEWLFQDDKGQVNALDLCGHILDRLEEYAEDDCE